MNLRARRLHQLSSNLRTDDSAALLVSFLFLVVMILLRIFLGYESYVALTEEDGVIEYITAILFFIGALIGFTFCWRAYNTGNRLLSLWVLMISSLFLVMALEEISYGQRVFDLATPETLSIINTQKELNIHNIGSFQRSLNILYIAVASYGIFSGLIVIVAFKYFVLSNKASTIESFWLLAVPLKYAPLFVPLLLYCAAWGYFHEEDSRWLLLEQRHEEPLELLFAWICCLYVRDKYVSY